jgi:hypothetical protein
MEILCILFHIKCFKVGRYFVLHHTSHSKSLPAPEGTGQTEDMSAAARADSW